MGLEIRPEKRHQAGSALLNGQRLMSVALVVRHPGWWISMVMKTWIYFKVRSLV